jgi:2-amino-4-hydroxy-6-hydroxymethyldihydropteridine diphosphokinase
VVRRRIGNNLTAMPLAYIGLGSNLDDPPRQLRAALAALAVRPALRLLAQSALYRSAPMGEPGQADYCNAVCCVETDLAPEALMAELLAVERAAGRVRNGRRWGPRVLDLDLLHYEGAVRHNADLTLPHPGIAQRNFVLWPLAEIAPALDIPGVGGIKALAERVGRAGLQLL